MFKAGNRVRKSAALRVIDLQKVLLRGVSSSILRSCAACGMSMHSRAWLLRLCVLDCGRLSRHRCICPVRDSTADLSLASSACIHVSMQAPKPARVPSFLSLAFSYRESYIIPFIISSASWNESRYSPGDTVKDGNILEMEFKTE